MTDPLYIDTETFCTLPISHGTYAYAAACEIDLFQFARGNDPVTVIDLQTCPRGDVTMIGDMLHEAEILVAWNAMFDRNVLRLGNLKIETRIEQWRCMMVRAMAHGLPGSLDKVGRIMGLPEDQRKLEAHKLMMLFCKPRPKNHKLRRATPATHPQERADYVRYAGRDVEALRALDRILPTWNIARDFPAPGEPWTAAHTELAHYHRDQRINDRGYQIDTALVEGAQAAVAKEQALLRAECVELTDGAVESATKRDVLLEYILQEHGLRLDDLRGATLDKVLKQEDLDDNLRALIVNRVSTCTTSTAKYRALQRGVSADGRLRGTLQMNGAQRTRRAGGRLFQPQNLPRPTMKNDEIETGIRMLKAGGAELWFDPMSLTSNAIRGCIIAAPGRKLVSVDLSNIEGRVGAWLAGEEWVLQAFRDFDAGIGPDQYKVEYAKAFGADPATVTKDQRQLGKVLSLFGQYQGSIGAFVTFAATYRVDLDRMADEVWEKLADTAKARAEDTIVWYRDNKLPIPPLRHKTVVAIFCLVHRWRDEHPAFVATWRGIEDNMRAAIRAPGKVFKHGKLTFMRSGAWLRVLMPSGRFLCYPHPKIDDSGSISYMGVDQFTKQWKRIHTYGGRVFENADQSMSRDIFYDSQPCIAEAGYDLCLHIHDDDVTEAPDTPDYSAEHLAELMTRPPSYMPDGRDCYAPGLPLAAAGFEAYRYRKD